jgi:LasA protease
MNKTLVKTRGFLTTISILALLIASCASTPVLPGTSATSPAVIVMDSASIPTPLPARPAYAPGELVEYAAQSGDTLPALAARFNTTVAEILAANTFIPREATTMPQGMPMRIPIYYRALWGTSFQIIPDHAFVNGPTANGFNTAAYVASQPGWLKQYRAYVSGAWRSGAELVDYVAVNYSIHPRLLLAILEYQGGALTQPEPPVNRKLLGLERSFWESHYLQMVLAANILNNGYYTWRTGRMIEFTDANNILIRPDPWQNSGSVALQYYYSQMFTGADFAHATGPEGLAKTYADLFGDPWQDAFELIPGSLHQPDLSLPFPADQTWSYTGGPHTGWGTGEPFAAIDFAPPAEKSGCIPAKSVNYATAVADGLIVRSSVDGVALDLDKDGNERTGWVIYYLHLAANERAKVGTELARGDKIGYPSCEGGRSTGTHVHVARKYNGEWIVADSAIPFNLSGWVARNGYAAYQGTLVRDSAVVIACDCGDAYTAINANFP